ncbi:MAG: restriction endonuclease subunit S [Euryarchaeota archaeon]|nr:restriction endonuclease subunit S [Euryarchaeota archaeon]
MKGQASRTGAGGDAGGWGMGGEQYPKKPMKKVATLVMGQSPPGTTYNEVGEDIPFYQGVRDFGGRHPSRRVYCTAPTRFADAGDVLFSVRAPIGEVNRATEHCSIGRGLAAIRADNPLDTTYLEYVLRHIRTEWDILEGQGAVFGNAKKSDLENLPVPWPYEGGRRAIASILGSLDDKIELNRQMNATLEQIGQVIFKHWFVDFEFPNEDGKPYRSSGGEMVDSELGEVPEGWGVTSIGDVVKVVGGGTPSTKNPAFWNGGTHCWTTPKDLSNISSPVLLDTARKITDAGLAKVSSRLLPIGTFLLSSRAPVGYTAIAQVPLAVNQGYIAIPPSERLSSLFLLHWTCVNLETIKGRACGTTFQEISKKNFRPIKIAVPTPEILTRFDRTVGRLFERIVANEQESRALILIRDTLLPKLMSGEIRANSGEIKPAQ